MKQKLQLIVLLFPFLLSACSSGKKALERGDYFNAVSKAVERLKSDTDNTKATHVLEEGYPMAIQWAQEEIDMALSSNQQFKWERTIDLMQQVNRLSRLIRSTPAARKIIPNPKAYTSEMDMAHQKAAKERYQVGLALLREQNRESARRAFENLHVAHKLVPGYNDVVSKLEEAKDMATYRVVVEAVTVQTRQYKLTSEFFYDQIFEYLNQRFPERSFVNFYSPAEAEQFRVHQPDFVVRMEFFDFSVGNLIQSEKEETVSRRVKIATKDTTVVRYKTYRAKLKTYTDEVISGGTLNYKIVDYKSNKLLRNNMIPGSFTWVNQYALFVGDEEALSDHQYNLTTQKAVPLPPHQDLFIEFTRPIYSRLTGELNSFFRRYK